MQTNSYGIRASYKVMLLLLMVRKVRKVRKVTSSQYLKKEVKDGVHFLHADEHQSFYKLALLFLMEVARNVQSAQNRKLVLLLKYLRTAGIEARFSPLEGTETLVFNQIKSIS